MHTSDLIMNNEIYNSNIKNIVNIHPTDISLDNNNNETPEHRFGTSKKYDSGLGILSPQSDDSFTNVFPNPDLNNTEHCYSTVHFPVVSTILVSPDEKWNSLCTEKEDNSQKIISSSNSIIELKTLDSNNNMSASIVIYRNDNRHINMIDFHPKSSSNVQRSNTFSNDKHVSKNFSPHKEMWRSTDNLTYAQTSLSTDDLCNNLFQGSSLSDHTTKMPHSDDSHKNPSLKSSSKILQTLVSTLCCRKHLPLRENSEEEITTFEHYPDWKLSLVDFDDITYFSSGAQGTIYTATLKDIKVALKKVKDTIKKDEIHIEHLMALNHRNIISFIGVSEEPPNYLVMEFCTQGQLFHWLRRDIKISPLEVCSWANQICDGMAYLHQNDIIHRDLKSPNILITGDNFLKIIDFEFSKDCCESKMLNSFVGTMAWMAPEVLREEVHTKKVDVWSYGVVLWEMITREIPYGGIERLSILFGVGNNCISLPLCDSIPIEIKELLRKCWEQTPDKRPSFQEILDNFNKYFDNLESYTQDEFTSMQLESKHEIEYQFQEINKEKISTSRVEAELIRRRTKELNDAKNIKEFYGEKLRRADKLIALLNKCLNAVEDERKKNDSEWRLIQRFKQSIFPNTTNKDNPSSFLSLQFQNRVANIKLPNDRSLLTTSPNRVFRKERSINRHSMLEPRKPVDKNNRVRRKHSVPSFKERSYFPGTKTKGDMELNTRDKKVVKVKSRKTSLSLETLINDPQRISSLNVDNITKKSENRWKRNSSPCRNVGFLTLPSPNKSCLNADDFSGAVNQSFQGSCDSFTNLRELTLTNSGTTASISDINNSRENMTDSLNNGPSQVLFRRNLLEESISECPHHEETHNLDEIREDIYEKDDNGVVVIRGISGRSKNNNIQNVSYQSFNDSLDVSMLNSQSQTAYSLIEKEIIAQGLIKPYGFLVRVNTDSAVETDIIYSNHERDDDKLLVGKSKREI